jgi:hypothetical protein
MEGREEVHSYRSPFPENLFVSCRSEAVLGERAREGKCQFLRFARTYLSQPSCSKAGIE